MRSAAENIKELVRGIGRRSRRLSPPRDYWKGRTPVAPFLPSNILLFSRGKPEKLLGHQPDQHHRFILIAALEGGGKVGIDAQMHILRPHQSLLIFPFQPHFYTDLSTGDFQWLFVSFECLRGSPLDALRNHGGLPLGREALHQVDHLLRAWQTPSRQSALSLHLALWLQGMIPATIRRRQKKRPTGQNASLVERVNQLLFHNRHHPFSIEQIASSLGFSASLLRKRFQEATGRSLGRHAREIRLSHACELLHDTTLRIEEIAARCGYESLFAFSRAFLHAFGRSPSCYRKERFS